MVYAELNQKMCNGVGRFEAKIQNRIRRIRTDQGEGGLIKIVGLKRLPAVMADVENFDTLP
jgi:hypothetical protein